MSSESSDLLEMELFYNSSGKLSFREDKKPGETDEVSSWIVVNFIEGTVDHVFRGDSCPWPRNSKECFSHIPMHTGSGEVVCEKCGEPCSFF